MVARYVELLKTDRPSNLDRCFFPFASLIFQNTVYYCCEVIGGILTHRGTEARVGDGVFNGL